jgi:hypothetical protein
MALSNGASFSDGQSMDTRTSSTEPRYIRMLGPVQPGADPDGGMAH